MAHREGSTGLDDRREAPAWSAWQGSCPTEAAPRVSPVAAQAVRGGRRRKVDCWTHLALQLGSKPSITQLRWASLRSAWRQRATPTLGAPAKRGRSCPVPTKRQKTAKVVENPIIPMNRIGAVVIYKCWPILVDHGDGTLTSQLLVVFSG